MIYNILVTEGDLILASVQLNGVEKDFAVGIGEAVKTKYPGKKIELSGDAPFSEIESFKIIIQENV